jgi:hypothetical protein
MMFYKQAIIFVLFETYGFLGYVSLWVWGKSTHKANKVMITDQTTEDIGVLIEPTISSSAIWRL